MIIKFSLNRQTDADILLFYKSGVPFNKIMKNALLFWFGAEYKELRVNPSDIPGNNVRPVLSLDENKDPFLIESMKKIPEMFRVSVIKSAVREYLKPQFMEYLGFEVKKEEIVKDQEKTQRSIPSKNSIKKLKSEKVQLDLETENVETKKQSEREFETIEPVPAIAEKQPDIQDIGLNDEKSQEKNTENIQNELFGLISRF